jgi:hypothetical protein
MKMKIGSKQTVTRLVKLHKCAGWPGSILEAKTNDFRFQQAKKQIYTYIHKIYYYLIIISRFQFCGKDVTCQDQFAGAHFISFVLS